MLIKSAKLIKLSPMLTHESIINFIEAHRNQLSMLGECILSAVQEVKMLKDEQVAGLVMVSIAFQGQPCLQVPKVLSKLDPERLEYVLESLRPQLNRLYNHEIAAWFCLNWPGFDKQTLDLINYLS